MARAFTWLLLMLALAWWSCRGYKPYTDAFCECMWQADSTFFDAGGKQNEPIP